MQLRNSSQEETDDVTSILPVLTILSTMRSGSDGSPLTAMRSVGRVYGLQQGPN
jgi:hypothetical protein